MNPPRSAFPSWAAWALIAPMAAATGSSAASTPERVTWHRDVGPLLQRHCADCHQPGGVAPFPLGRLGRRMPEMGDLAPARRPIHLYAALAEAAR